MDEGTPYYATQGGGTAVMQDNRLVWETPPDWFAEASPGDSVPEEWSVLGPFDRKTNLPSPS